VRGTIDGMTTATAFRGWSDAALDFYQRLEADNSRSFWTANKDVYESEVRAPFEALSDLVTDEFGPLKIFRPHRDVRFSKDKTPYKTRCYAATEGEAGEAYYVELSTRGLVAAAGYWMMANDQLARYRAAVDDDRAGGELVAVVADLRRRKLGIEGHQLKTAPRGWPRDHPRIELLRHKSLAVVRSFEPAAWLATRTAARRITDTWRAARALNEWLGREVGPSTEPPPDRW
jgi:uncharacterized protein (TIGR02453 family)